MKKIKFEVKVDSIQGFYAVIITTKLDTYFHDYGSKKPNQFDILNDVQTFIKANYF